MAWSAPPTWTVGQVVTAAQMTVLSDDLNYLKGSAGAVQIDNDLTAVLAAGGSVTAQGTNNGAFARLRLLTKRSSGTVVDWRILANGISDTGELVFYDTTAAAERLRIENNGNVGVGTAAPLGRFHAKGIIGNWTMWEFDGLAGVAQTVLATGSASFAQAGWALVRNTNSGISQTTVLTATPLSTITIGNFNAGADVVQLQTASGGFTVVRTAGSHVYKVVIFLLTL